MTVKLSRDPGTSIKYPSLHSFVERSRDPGTKTTVIYSSLSPPPPPHTHIYRDWWVTVGLWPMHGFSRAVG